MNRTSRSRRNRLASAASGFPEREAVVLYACIHDGRDPTGAMADLRRHAEVRDWVVRGAFYDQCALTRVPTDRMSWPEVERLLRAKEVGGLVARSEDEIAFLPPAKQRLREWLWSLRAFARYTGDSTQKAGTGSA